MVATGHFSFPSTFAFLWCFVFLILPSSAKIEKGVIHTDRKDPDYNWKFLTRFCFLSHVGRLSFNFRYPKYYDDGVRRSQNILLYHDDQWPKVYGPKFEHLSCAEREAVLRPENNQVINLTTRYTWSGCDITQGPLPNGSMGDWYSCIGGRTFSSIRERWWFLVVDNCKTEKGMYLQYQINMTNDEMGNPFFHHFSADEFYILQLTMVFLVIYLLLGGLSLYVAYSLHLRQLYHATYKMYLGSLSMHTLSLIIAIIFWGDYSQTGEPKLGWKNLALFVEFAGYVLFIILLVLMAKGFTITRGRISPSGTIKLIVFSCIYIAAIVISLILASVTHDEGLVLYLYDTPSGYVIIAMWIITWLWFIYGIFFTLKHYPEKQTFYIPFAVLYSLLFWASPTIALVAITSIPMWLRAKLVQGISLLVMFLGHLIFLILTWPTLANKNFPYHIRTTQIGVATGDQGGGAREESCYAPSSIPITDDNLPVGERRFLDVFTVSSARSQNSKAVDIDRFPHDTSVATEYQN